jgi:hypothetical protein
MRTVSNLTMAAPVKAPVFAESVSQRMSTSSPAPLHPEQPAASAATAVAAGGRGERT